MNNKKLATQQTYDPNSLTSTGYDFTLYADGSVSAEYRSRWQGSYDGCRYRSAAGIVPTENPEQSLAEFVERFEWDVDLPDDEGFQHGNYGFRETFKGVKVQ